MHLLALFCLMLSLDSLIWCVDSSVFANVTINHSTAVIVFYSNMCGDNQGSNRYMCHAMGLVVYCTHLLHNLGIKLQIMAEVMIVDVAMAVINDNINYVDNLDI